MTAINNLSSPDLFRRPMVQLLHLCHHQSMPSKERTYAIYLLASKRYGTLYIGVTGDLVTRIAQHKEGSVPGFTSKYGVKQLVWFELFGEIDTAIQREKTMKKWPRQWKINLIERDNPNWIDLYQTLL